jgi:hypothetical protein
MTERRGSRRELALVACALLLPIPVLAASGLGIPLPSQVERGLASLLPLAGGPKASVPTLDSGTAAAPDGSTGGQPATEGPAAVPVEGALPPGTPFPPGVQEPSGGATSGSGGGTGSGGSGDEPSPPTGDDTPPDDGPAPEDGPAPGDGPAPDVDKPSSSEPRSAGPSDAPPLTVAVAGPGASAGASLSGNAGSVDVSLGDGEQNVGVSADTAVDEGSVTDVGGGLPNPGLGIP